MSNGGPVKNQDNNDPYKFYFQLDTEWVKKYMDNLLKEVSPTMLPVSSWFSSIADGKKSLYLGNNYWNEGVWKQKHFIYNKLQSEYVNHLQSHARHFLNQPRYYKGLYEILN